MSEADVPERFAWLRHAYIGRDSKSPPRHLDTEWVGLFRETELDGAVSYGVEHLDRNFGEICGDDIVNTEAEAQAYAEAQSGLGPGDWREGRAREPEA